jgi:hypothetical protein
MSPTIQQYNESLLTTDKLICNLLTKTIDLNLKEAESKIWHGHPVWFIDGNPIVGYSKQKKGLRLLFWSGNDFNEALLIPGSGKFKDASILYQEIAEVNTKDLKRWLIKSREIQWDYKNIVKRKGKLIPILPNPFQSIISAPAQRALKNAGIETLEQLSAFSENEILEFHGMGKSSIPKLKNALSNSGLKFKTTY